MRWTCCRQTFLVPSAVCLWTSPTSNVGSCVRARLRTFRVEAMDKFVTRKRPAEASSVEALASKKVSVSSTTTSSDAALANSKRVAVPAESAVLNSVDDTLKNDAEQAAERVTDASHGPSLATASVQAAGRPVSGIVSAVSAVSAATAVTAGPSPILSGLLNDNSWKPHLADEFRKPYFVKLERFIKTEWATQQVFPASSMIFRVFNTCPFDDVKVVILGQDPYHNVNQAMGLSFSVPAGQPVPSSLKNMYKEIATDCGCTVPKHGNLVKWAEQGVLLLNVCLTVRAHQANSHAKQGWEPFTDAAISALNRKKRNVVFLLWGKSAELKAKGVDRARHHVLTAAHPSGLSANRVRLE
ncbi:TPA: uracil DNA glycosylase [Trebouxia sp. C0004]